MKTIFFGAAISGVLLSACGGGGSQGTGAGGASAGSGSASNGSSMAMSSSSGAGTGGASSSGSGSGGMGPTALCPPLPPPSGNITAVTPADASNLQSLAYNAKDGDTLLLDDGTYHLGGAYMQFVAGATLRGKSGDPTKVIIDGDWQSNEVVQVTASNTTEIADVTLARAINHPIHVVSTPQADTLNTMIYNVIVLDPGEQGIKINADGSGHHVDKGTIACSTISMTADGRSHVMNNCYTGGVDGHDAEGWVVRDNHIDGFWCPSGLSEHGVHFWTGSRGTLVERNVISNCARGIGFGLGQGTPNRTFPDNPCPGVATAGHYLGVVRNNFVFASDPGLIASASGFDTGIGLEDACGAVVAHNTVFATKTGFASLDARFPQTKPVLANNLLSGVKSIRDGAAAAADQGNLEMVPGSLFKDPSGGDLHLLPGAAQAIDKGAMVPGAVVTDDIDGETRDQKPDLGADESMK